MKNLVRIGLTLVFSLFALLASSSARSDHCRRPAGDLPTPLLAQMDALNAKVSEGLFNKDIDLVMSCYANTEDVQLVASGQHFRGVEAVRQATLALLGFPGTIRNEYLSIHYTRVGELILVVGTERNTFTPADGSAPFAIDIIWSDVRKKIGGKWVMILNHATQLD